ncbi:type VI secretion system-associated FHA domain protein TagH [Undibacterium sp. TS12]|uniref:type VI secretion system-associated FHA domain protein TagH n=1 Tax=Undibacterium sp. TS12 TaxID=2908202 RepID=UPI001F4CD912|nr:type VI secretion system-associated FHA domain protein TagH [Undibacterium sp. TS12]MCH8617981.1 type VI secretion system-associated FHA domain protein TagH [Undibacterium sp. TS12]
MIKIVVVSYNNEAPAEQSAAVFGPEPASIGRNVENFLVLPDPKHLVSRTQAKAWSTGGQHFVSNLSAANPILVNGKEIEAEVATEIHPGDQLQIGLYLLRAEAIDGETGDVLQVPMESTLNSTADPDTDAMKENTQPPARLIPGRINPRPQPPQFLLRPEVVSQKTTDAAADKTNNEAVPVTTVADEPSVQPGAGAAAKPLSNANELVQAFLQGAGLQQVNLASGLTVELMETLGKFMASSVKGAMDELSQRALLKREVKAEVTMVVLRENNPLKFFPDSKTVLTQMLRKKMPGFMAPAEAIEDAFFDIRTHQMGVAAGTRAVTESILKTLQPASVEAHLGAPGLLDQINPARRKAAMWDQFSELFDTISAGKKDEFQSLFGKEFLLAYEKEVEKAELNR